jgi:hypothetical protein
MRLRLLILLVAVLNLVFAADPKQSEVERLEA